MPRRILSIPKKLYFNIISISVSEEFSDIFLKFNEPHKTLNE
jgi:hypothetical protein